MRTQKSISNIAYLRPSYFAIMVKALRAAGKIGTCYWIAHKAEVEGEKDHIHFVLLGGEKVYNTDGLAPLFGFDVVDGEKQSVTNRWCVTKDIRDWLCYSVHDSIYLSRKGLSREYHYQWTDIQCSDGDGDRATLERDIIEAKRFLDDGGDKFYKILRALAKSGKSWREVVLSGLIPLPMLRSAYDAYLVIAGAVRADSQPLDNGSTPPKSNNVNFNNQHHGIEGK